MPLKIEQNYYYIYAHVCLYTLTISGDSFEYQSGQMFSTFDSDNDGYDRNCAAVFNGGWWYNSCKLAYLNGKYYKNNPTAHDDGIQWYDWRGDSYSLKHTEMKIRRL